MKNKRNDCFVVIVNEKGYAPCLRLCLDHEGKYRLGRQHAQVEFADIFGGLAAVQEYISAHPDSEAIRTINVRRTVKKIFVSKAPKKSADGER